jgi:hypothetical protein
MYGLCDGQKRDGGADWSRSVACGWRMLIDYGHERASTRAWALWALTACFSSVTPPSIASHRIAHLKMTMIQIHGAAHIHPESKLVRYAIDDCGQRDVSTVIGR